MDESSAQAKALALLSRRDLSRKTLQARLKAWGCDAATIDTLLERLAGWGYLNDERVAGSLTRRRSAQGFGPRRIKHELRHEGLENDLSAPPDDVAGDWASLARDIWRRRFGDMPAKDAREQARRLRYMLNRGFTMEQIRACLKGAGDLDDLPDDVDD